MVFDISIIGWFGLFYMFHRIEFIDQTLEKAVIT